MSGPLGGRPLYEPTPEQRAMVERLAGMLVREDEICRDWIKPPIARMTLRKHFGAELRHGRERTRARVLLLLWQSAERSGSKASTRAALWLLERYF
jgi:hypothetical protein